MKMTVHEMQGTRLQLEAENEAEHAQLQRIVGILGGFEDREMPGFTIRAAHESEKGIRSITLLLVSTTTTGEEV